MALRLGGADLTPERQAGGGPRRGVVAIPDTTSEAGSRAQERLRSEEIAWLTTGSPDGQPQSVPVWSLWDGEGFLVLSKPGARKLRNIEANPKINLNLNSNANGGDVVRAECVAEVLADVLPAAGIGPYLEKYREGIARIGFDPGGFARAYSVAIRATPIRWQAW